MTAGNATALVRAARSAPSLPLSRIAKTETAQTRRGAVGAALDSLRGRTRCASAVAAAARVVDTDAAFAALTSGRCPPPTARSVDIETLPSRTRDRLNGSSGWVARTAGSPGASRWLLAQLAERVAVGSRFSAAIHPRCPPPLLCRLVRDPNSAVRRAVALNLSTPSPLLQILTRDRSTDVRGHAIAHPRCPPHILEAAAAGPGISTHMSVARNRACPPHLLTQFADESCYPELRRCALSHPGCPPESLRRYARARRRRETIRLAAAYRDHFGSAASPRQRTDRSTPPFMTHATVSYRIAKDAARNNPGCPMSPLGRLRRLAAKAAQRLSALFVGGVRRSATERQVRYGRDAPRSRLRPLGRLATSADPLTRRAAAADTECPSALLARLAQDTHPAVRVEVARNPGCAPRTLDRLEGDPDARLDVGLQYDRRGSAHIPCVSSDDRPER